MKQSSDRKMGDGIGQIGFADCVGHSCSCLDAALLTYNRFPLVTVQRRGIWEVRANIQEAIAPCSGAKRLRIGRKPIESLFMDL